MHSGVSRVGQVGQVPWVLLEGGRHSTGLFLTYASRLTFLTVLTKLWFCEIKKKLAYFSTIVIFSYYQLVALSLLRHNFDQIRL